MTDRAGVTEINRAPVSRFRLFFSGVIDAVARSGIEQPKLEVVEVHAVDRWSGSWAHSAGGTGTECRREERLGVGRPGVGPWKSSQQLGMVCKIAQGAELVFVAT